MSQPAAIDYNIWRNADWRQAVIWAGTDLSGSTFAMDIKVARGDGATAASATIDDTDADTGTLVLSLPDEALDAGTYYYDLVGTDSGVRTLLAYGTITVHEGVTQP